MKKLTSLIVVLAITLSAIGTLTVHADETLEPINCTQSASYLNNNGNQVLVVNTSGTETPSNVSWNTASKEWKGVAVLEFEMPAINADMIKSAAVSVTVNNPSTNRKGTRTYGVYAADISIRNETVIADLDAIPLTNSFYTSAGITEGTTRQDTISNENITNYIKSRANAEGAAKIQFAFSTSDQPLDIDPKTATLTITTYGGGIALNQNKLTMSTADASASLTAKIFAQGIEQSDFVWESSDDSIATVSGGVITPKKAGIVTITVRTADNEYADTCEVTVLQAAEGISIDKTSMTLVMGGKNGEVTAKAITENSVSRVTYESENTEVATVTANGIVTPVAEGNAVITAKTDANLSAQCAVTVVAASPATSITLDKDAVTLTKLGSTAVLHANVAPANTDGKITWTSSDEKVAKVIDGVVISEKPGTATITASTSNGLTAQCTITVNDDKQLITNDRFYTDTDGNNLYSQGGGIFKFGDTYYWYGVRYKESDTYAKNPQPGSIDHPAFEAYTCYTSKDLVNWEYKGEVATTQTLGQAWCGWAGRMGVVYHKKSDKYILCSQFNGVIIASADNPLGPFTTEKGYFWGGTPLPVIKNGDTGDQTMFQDDDGKAYMICSSAKGRGHLYVVPMDDSKDYCDFDFANIKEIDGSTSSYFDEDGVIRKKDKGGIEGDCMFKYKGKYYFTGSDLYGWHGSRVYVFQSDSILGDYNIKPNYNISDADKTKKFPYIMKNAKQSYAHNSQTGFYYTLHGSKQETVIYCGDRWCDFGGHGIGYNEWVPLSFEGENDTPVFNDLSQWRLDAETGEWSVGEGNNYIANNEFDADRISVQNLTGWECESSTGTACGNVKAHPRYGTYAAKHDGAEDYKAVTKQTIKDLPDGVYTLRASVMSSGGQNECVLYANNGEKEYSTSLKSAMKDWTDIVIKDIEVKDGECEIGVRSDANSGNYVRFDDMYFTKNTEPGTLITDSGSLKLIDADGTEVSTIEAGKTVHAKVSYTSTGALSNSLTLYMALYNKDGVLGEVKTANKKVMEAEEGYIETDSITIGDDVSNVYIKLFLWDNKQKPLADVVEIKKDDME